MSARWFDRSIGCRRVFASGSGCSGLCTADHNAIRYIQQSRSVPRHTCPTAEVHVTMKISEKSKFSGATSNQIGELEAPLPRKGWEGRARSRARNLNAAILPIPPGQRASPDQRVSLPAPSDRSRIEDRKPNRGPGANPTTSCTYGANSHPVLTVIPEGRRCRPPEE